MNVCVLQNCEDEHVVHELYHPVALRATVTASPINCFFSYCSFNLQGPLLPVLMQCCNSSSLEVQQLALASLNSLATVPEHLPAFSKV